MMTTNDEKLASSSTGVELSTLSSSNNNSLLVGDTANNTTLPSNEAATTPGIPLYDEYMCRICLEEGRREEFIAPCNCTGSSKWVHRQCLDKWRSMREDRAFSQCTECLSAYELQCITTKTRNRLEEENDGDDSDEDETHGLLPRHVHCVQYSSECRRRTRFFALVSRDLLFLLLIAIFIIALATLLAMISDVSLHHYFIHLLHMDDKVLLGYFVLGLILFFAYIGFHYGCVYLQCCGPCNNGSDGRFYTFECCNDTVFLPYYMTPDMHPTCCCIECGNGGACECCGSGAGAGAGSGCECCGSAGAGCCECSSVELGHELIVFFFAAMVILAVIGVFVSIFVGVVVLQSIITRHIHVLRKWTLTKEYIVKDLAPGAVEVHSVDELSAAGHNNNHQQQHQKLIAGEDSDVESVDSFQHGHNGLDATMHGVDSSHGSEAEWNPTISTTLSNLVSRRGGGSSHRHGNYSLVTQQEHVDETTLLHPANTSRVSPAVMDDQARHSHPGEGLTAPQRQVLERMGLL